MSVFTSIGNNRKYMAELHEQFATSMGVVPFVGAGFCVSCGLPDWSTLLRQLAQTCGNLEKIDDLIRGGGFEEAASALEQSLGAATFARHLRNRLSGSAIRQLAGPILRTPALTHGPVVTTNLDCILEQVFAQSGYPFERVGLGPNVEAIRGALHQNHAHLIKIHGGLDDPATRVLTLDDYQRAYGSRDARRASRELALPRLLEQIFTSRTLLFLGCSLQTDRTLTYLKHVKREHGAPALHFALLSDPGDESARDSREEFLAEVNVRPIWYPQHRHDFIDALLDEVTEPKFRSAFPEAKTKLPVAHLGGCLAIDLGTSFSAVGYEADNGTVHCCRLSPEDRDTLVPTVVSFLNDHEYTICGDQAARARPEDSVRNFKRHLGSNHRYRIGRRDYSAAHITALFLKGIKLALEAQFDGSLPPVAVAIPANFSTRQVRDLGRAVDRAGFRLARFVGEPCAAGLNLREFRRTHDLTFMVIDIGGGTTDISVIERTRVDHDFVFEVGCVAGDNMLGGVDFDAVVCELIRERLLAIAGTRGALIFERQRAFIEERAMELKHDLNRQKTAAMTLTNIELKPGQLTSLRIEITRKQFFEASRALLARIETLIDHALSGFATAGFNPAMIGALMLAGQSSKLGPIRALLRRKLRLPIIREFQDDAVVTGLARQAHLMSRPGADRLLLDVMYQGIYMVCPEGTAAYRDYNSAPFIERSNPSRRVDLLTDASGRTFLPLIERYQSVPSWSATQIELALPVEQMDLEIYESGDNPDRPFELRKKWHLQFSEPMGEFSITVNMDINRDIELDVSLRHAYILSAGPSANDQRRVAKFHVTLADREAPSPATVRRFEIRSV
jgi:molecular chaperone DnaK (HSP70)